MNKVGLVHGERNQNHLNHHHALVREREKKARAWKSSTPTARSDRERGGSERLAILQAGRRGRINNLSIAELHRVNADAANRSEGPGGFFFVSLFFFGGGKVAVVSQRRSVTFAPD